jgi:hypothetical protein
MLKVACCIKGHSPMPIDIASPLYSSKLLLTLPTLLQKEINFESRILARVKTITG